MAGASSSAIDLFSGCGGLSLGLKRAGFKILAAVERDELASSTYQLNHPRVQLHTNDIREIDAEQLRASLSLKRGELGLLAGCPPCQGFSTLRTLNGSRLVEDPNNDLIFEFMRFVDAFQPKTLMVENVPGLLKDDRLLSFRRKLSWRGYLVRGKILDAADFGVPQRRRRMILLAARGFEPSFAPASTRRRTVSTAIRSLPEPKDSSDAAHNYRVRRAQHVVDLIKKIPIDGGGRMDLAYDEQLACHKGFNGFYDVYGRLSWNAPSVTITGSCINPSKGRFLHPDQHRAITLREAALLQGFPKSYRLDMTKGRYPAAQMIGNAFPPKFAEVHARHMLAQILES